MDKTKFKFSSWKVIDTSGRSIRITDVSINFQDLLFNGAAYQSPKDADHRAIGQKYAVTNALKEVSDIEVRRIIWNDFFQLSKKTRKLVGE